MMDSTPHAQQALQALRREDIPGAERLARQALAINANSVPALVAFALALGAQQRGEEALPAFQRLVALEPGVATHWTNLGNCLCALGREADARDPLMRARTLGDDDEAVHFALARVYSVTGPARVGLEHIEQAIARAPAEIEFRLFRAKLLATADEWEAANEEVEALMREPLGDDQRADLGHLLLHGNLYAEALQVFEEILQRDPAHADSLIGAVMTLERVNRIEDSAALRTSFPTRLDAGALAKIDAKLMQVDARLASRRGDHAATREHLAALLSRPVHDPMLRISLYFELGAACDRLGLIDEAMSAFARSHAERAAMVDGNHPSLVRGDSLFVALEQPPLALPAARAAPDGRKDPVFVVGFPRSGTTLLEQLLDAHPALASFDEQPFLQRIVRRLTAGGAPLQPAIEALDAEAIGWHRDAYFADVAGVLPALGECRPVDKNPLNLVRLGVIQPILPDTRVILAIRHPCDVVLSCYMQSFRAPVFAVTFETLAACADTYDRVFSHWWADRERFSLPVHTLRYEDLVADTEGEARRLFDFLSLPWQPELLDFTERARGKGAISTPSYTQVVEPVNARAVGRWQRYRKYFDDDILERLSPWIERFGYPPVRP